MKLEKLILVNWGALRSGVYDMGNMTLLTGPTGAGKSTLLDALQTVMTAAYQNIYNYNPSQDETSQGSRNGKTKRTLWSYIVGAEDNLFSRPDGAHGYIAAVFSPSEGETGKAFTALVAVAARVDGSGSRRQAVMERLAFLIIDDAALSYDDLVPSSEGPMEVVPVEKIELHLKARYPTVTSYRDTKREYLCQLYGRFRGQRSVSFAEAELAAKAWSQSIAHKPIGSVDELVKTQILEHDPQQLLQRISQTSDLMRNVHNLRVEGERLTANVARLERIGTSAKEATGAYESAIQFQLATAKRSFQEDEREAKEATQAVKDLLAAMEDDRAALKLIEADSKAHTDSLIQLEAQLNGIPAAAQKRRIDDRREAALEGIRNGAGALHTSLAAVIALHTTARQLSGMQFPLTHGRLETAAHQVASAVAKAGTSSTSDSVALAALMTQLKEIQAATDPDPRLVLASVRQLETVTGTFEELHQTLAGAQGSFLAAVHGQLGQLDQALMDAQEHEQTQAARKANLAGGGADYPREIQVALTAFRTDLPEAQAQALCDLVEPAHSDWQPAIEGYLGMARFNFIVDPAWEARAIEFVRQRHLKTRVIQGSACLKNFKPERVPADSIIHELNTDHPIAKAYLTDQFGQVVKVASVEELRHTARGVMRDGTSAGSRTMYTGKIETLVFGKEAQRLAREKAVSAHQEAELALADIQGQKKQLMGLLGLVAAVQLPTLSEIPELERATHELTAAAEDLGRLDLSEVAGLDSAKTTLGAQIDLLSNRRSEVDRSIGVKQGKVDTASQLAAQLQSGLEAKALRVAEETTKLQQVCKANDALSFTAMEQAITQMLADGTYSSQQQLQGRVQSNLLAFTAAHGDLREAVAEYNQHARGDEALAFSLGVEHRSEDFAPLYALILQLLERVRAQLGLQREVGLVKNLDQLRTAEQSFKDVFTKQFCYEIRNAVDIGVRTLKTLNAELDQLKFGTDKFRIDWSEWVPEFKEYYGFFSAAYDLSESQESGDLFVGTELSPENCRIRDRLVGLLLSNDQDKALKELQRVADYRNYRRYEIWKDSDSGSHVALSEWGTGSGGQLETPAYIIRAAVVTNRLKHFDKGTNLKLLVNDESFARMDERRAHDVLRFIRDSLGMQFICAMPTKHAGAIKSEFTKEWCFTRTEASGNGEVDFVSEADERNLHPDRLRVLWDERREQVRAQGLIKFEDEERAAAG